MKPRRIKYISTLMLLVFVNQLLAPMTAYALTSGPSQPEVQSFEPFSTSEMVSLSSGDFTYNIPLMEIEGYPLNISYSSGISMDQEASWVGLGWNINPGVINRNMRGIPDDFDGDIISKEFNVKSNNTYGISFLFGGELLGIDMKKLGLSMGINFNNYRGVGLDMSMSPSMSSGHASKGSMTASLGISISSESGLGITPQLSFSKNIEKKAREVTGVQGKIGLPFNSRGGLSSLTISSSRTNYKKESKSLTPDQAKKAASDGTLDADGNAISKDATEMSVLTEGISGNGGSSISFAGQTYTPTINLSMFNISLSTSYTGGLEVFGIHPNTRINGYYSGQHLMGSSRSLPAYGYMNAQHGQARSEVMMDFNREKDGGFTENTPSLPLTNFSYDIYSVSGQGISGMYRPYRSDIGYVFDSEMHNYSANLDLPGIELGAGNAARGGLNFTVNGVNAHSGKWIDDNMIANAYQFRDFGHNGDNLFEPWYFKQAGEKAVETDPEFVNRMGGYDAQRIEVLTNLVSMPALSSLKNEKTGASQVVDANNFRKKRSARNEVVQTLNAEEANLIGTSKYIESYPDVAKATALANPAGAFDVSEQTNKNRVFKPNENIVRVSDFRRKHHISEIVTYRTDGTRYIFGIPAYNNFQRDVTFAVSGRNANPTTGMVDYLPNIDNTPNNKNGIDHYFDRVNTPGYAHSYLLTAVLGANYVDLADDGPTYDDLGGYTKFNYSRVSKDFQWRTPVGQNEANHSEGFKSQRLMDEFNDDKASYIYGEKELWYVHSIETKNYVALFYTSYREDGLGVQGENGGVDLSGGRNKTCKLDKIELYARQDLVTKGVEDGTPGKAVPIKTVHFAYNYSQCGGIGNRTSGGENGKLTLKEIYFTYGSSQKSRLSSYQFNYGEIKSGNNTYTINPAYNMKGNDRWGNYKLTQGAEPGGFSSCMLPSTLASNAEFPYTDQDKFNQGSCVLNGMYKADVYAYAWALTTIELPSGGEINIDYESDDYAYVQDRRAMQMTKVIGVYNDEELVSFDPASSTRNQMYSLSSFVSRNWLAFDVTDYINGEESFIGNPTEEAINLRQLFFNEFNGTAMNYLYFKFLIKLRDNKEEWVPGYLKFDKDLANFKIKKWNDRYYGLVKIKDEPTALGILDQNYNQISYTAWNFMRIHLPRLAYNQADRNQNGIMQIFKSLESMGNAIVQTFTGYARFMRDDGQCARIFDNQKSYIRLYCPNNFKKGGGSRVKRIRSIDNWDKLTNDNNDPNFNFDYGQEYNYTTKNEYKQTISSGVAGYEPGIGNDENPFKQPVFYSEEKLLAPDDDFYQEEPYGESFFPSPGVVYSKVTVKSLVRENVKSNSTGNVVHEFYTAKDFPTITQRTSIQQARMKPSAIMRIISYVVEDYMTATQGYSIELNDMHGKPKAQWVFASQTHESHGTTESPISGVEYKYKQSGSKRLSNTTTVVTRDGKTMPATVGIEIDQVADFREQNTVSRSGGTGGNLDAFLAALLPITIPVVLPTFSKEEVRFRSAVLTKVINRYGLLDETITYDGGAATTSKNIALDAETGEVLLKKSTNMFGDVLYDFTYPAHWVYDKMGQVYRNIGYFAHRNGGPINIINNPNLVPGDEVLVILTQVYGKAKMRGWVAISANPSIPLGSKNIINENGLIIEPGIIEYIKVIRSGRKNMQGTPIGSVTQLSDPINWLSELSGQLELTDNLLSSSAIEYSDDWKIFCECELAWAEDKAFNKILRKRGGAWRPQTNWTYLVARKQKLTNDNTNIRTDGIYESYNPFWEYNVNTGFWSRTSNTSKWQYKTQGTIYSPYGLELESKDPLGRYSAATYGYNNILPTSVTGNAQYREVGFDGFEDYGHLRCDEDHFSYKPQVKLQTDDIEIDNTQSHSGKKSLKVKANKTTTMSRKIQVTCP